MARPVSTDSPGVIGPLGDGELVISLSSTNKKLTEGDIYNQIVDEMSVLHLVFKFEDVFATLLFQVLD